MSNTDLQAVHEISLKYEKKEINISKRHITGSDIAYNIIKQFYNSDINIYETVYAIFLNTANSVIGVAKIGQGGLSSSIVETRIIYKIAIDLLSSGVILVHNHPSGEIKPSDIDKAITNKLKKGLKTLDIRLLDHLVISNKDYFSFADEGLL